MKIKLTVAYDGAAWHGWRSQRSGRGVQDALESALGRLVPGASPLESSSRTDAGVHAWGLVAHFAVARNEMRLPVIRLALALNALLPPDVRVRSAVRVPDAFHARFDATGKQYRYLVWNHPVMNPLLCGRAWHVPQRLDRAAMAEAAHHFLGRHDFRAFTTNRGGKLGDPVRTLTRCDVRCRGPRVSFIIEGGGFLYKMCRAITGTLIQVGQGRIPAADVPAILASGDRRNAGMNAPAHGLVLWKVFYPPRR